MLHLQFIVGNKDGGLLTLFILEPILGIVQMCHVQKLSAEKIKLTKITLKKLCSHVIQILLEDTKNEGSVDCCPTTQNIKFSINPLVPNASFLYPLKISEK